MNSSSSAPRRRTHEALKSRACTVLALRTPSRNVCEHAAALAECTRCSRAGTRRQEHRVATMQHDVLHPRLPLGDVLIESSIAFWCYPQTKRHNGSRQEMRAARVACARDCVQGAWRRCGIIVHGYETRNSASIPLRRPPCAGFPRAVLCVASRSSPTCGLGSHRVREYFLRMRCPTTPPMFVMCVCLMRGGR